MKTIKHLPFFAEVIKHLHASGRVGECLFVFPTQLSIDYCQSLCYKGKGPDGVTGLTLYQLMLAHSRLKLLPTLTLLSRLHQLAEQVLNRKESFEQFYSWGLTLLQDFNDIDTHLINGAALFASLIQQKKQTIDAFVDQDPLAPLKKARALSLFQQQEALPFWQQLPLLYQSFRENLIEQGEGYEGLCYSMAQPLPERMATYQELIFVGFNMLTPVEEQFVQQCKAVAETTFFWDADPHYLDHPSNIAGHYLRQHREKKWFQKSFPAVGYLNDPHKRVLCIETASMVTQVQAVVAALQEKTDDGQPRFLPNQTAIVVSGSDLLIPLLDQLSKLAIPIHCRLDYPFSATVIYTLLERLVQLWEAAMEKKQQESHMADVLALCRPFVAGAVQSEITAIGPSLDGPTLYQSGVFDLWLNKAHKELLPYLQERLTYIACHFVQTDDLFLELNKSALEHLVASIDALMVAMDTCSISFLLNSLKKSSLPFHQHNPLTGLYIVEVTASYNLDFDNVFFLNMNEGCFPKPTPNDSLVPYDLRYAFGLPFLDKVAENKTAYGFYRLLQRTQHIYGYYTQKNSLDASSEMSRLLMQLIFDSKLKITHSCHAMHLPDRSMPVISIQKDHAVMQLLNRFWVKEAVAASSLTPSELIAYLACPLQFYFIYLLQLKQTVWPKEAKEAVQLGTLFHHVMAKCYQPFVGVQMDKEIILELKSSIKIKIEEAIAAQPTELRTPMLLHALLEKLLARMLDLDGADQPFTILGVEVAMKQAIELNVDVTRKVWLSGVVDRIDRQTHLIRMVDYKTGVCNSKISSIASLFDRAKIKKNKAIFQTFFYAWLFKSLHRADEPRQVMPYLIHIRELFLADYRPGIFIQQPGEGKKYQRIEDIMAYIQPFEEGLRALLLEIFNPAIPFVQTEDLEICAYCPYVRICQRD